MTSRVVYTSTVVDDRAPTTLTVRRDGSGELTVGSNRDRRSEPVGRFEAAVSPEMLQTLFSLTASAEFSAVESVADLLPGDPYRQVQVVQDDGVTATRTVGAGKHAPAVFVAAEQAAQAIQQHLLAHPTVAIAMVLEHLPERVESRESAVGVTIRNVGQVPFLLAAPAEWGKSHTTCELTALRDVPESQLTLADQKFASLGGNAVVVVTKPAVGGLVVMEPDESVSVRFRCSFQWPAGAYLVQVTLSLSLTGMDGKPLFAGNLVAGPSRVEVVARPVE